MTRDETQGGNWSTLGCTLFISVICFLCKTTWDTEPQHLPKGQPVSVEIDDEFGILYRYGEVVDEWTTGEEDLVRVLHPSLQKIVTYSVNRIRMRKMITVPHVVVSDYKGHDSNFVKCYLDELLLGPNSWFMTQTSFPGLKERLTEVHIDSDGAASHFKQKDSLFSITEFLVKYCLFHLTWTFGAPGHGKGTWDGFGGILKNAATRRIISESLIVNTAQDVFDLLILLFCSEVKEEEYARTKRIKVKSWSINLLSNDAVLLYPSIEQNVIHNIEAFDGAGSQRIFFYEAFHRGGLGYQLSACWCAACIRGLRHGAFKGILGCFSGEPLEYRVLKRTDLAWEIDTNNRTRNLACDLSRTLQIGDVIAYDPKLSTGSRRSCRFDIGQVTLINYPYSIVVSSFKSDSDTDYVMKSITSTTIHRDTIRFRFPFNPITISTIRNKNIYKIVLSDEIYTTITKKNYNGK